MGFIVLSVVNVTGAIFLFSSHLHPLCWCCPLIRGSLLSCLLYQRDLHLKKPTVPTLCSMLVYSSTNRPWPTCSFNSRLPSYHQVRPCFSLTHLVIACYMFFTHRVYVLLSQRMAKCVIFYVKLARSELYVQYTAWM